MQINYIIRHCELCDCTPADKPWASDEQANSVGRSELCKERCRKLGGDAPDDMEDILEAIKDKVSPCYIATMAYGNIEHPQVIELRRFRDEKLQAVLLGKAFIRFYYKFSPLLVEKLKNKRFIHKIIRGTLDAFIKMLSKVK